MSNSQHKENQGLMAHPRGFEPLTSAFGGLWLWGCKASGFFNKYSHLIATGARSQSPHLPHVPNHNGMLVMSICVAADASRVRTTHTMTCPFCHGSAETMAMADHPCSVSSKPE